ncbi:MAG: cob(I)yrinic acid a,c-diamide adenosyltransferase [Firmicutes bacterium]|nr:cob(I)yrinic acid a,c-diamide adenosyltransferase [Bacillota bacterium]
MKGLVHIYCGDGKGKTTAASGLAARAAGAGKKVIFCQFFKTGESSEIKALRTLPAIEMFHCKTVPGFYYKMTPEQKQQAQKDYSALCQRALQAAAGVDVLILDEAISACNYGVIDEDMLREFIRNKPEGLEMVLTGRDPSPALLELADYVTEMRKIKHPFDQGIAARRGIEF